MTFRVHKYDEREMLMLIIKLWLICYFYNSTIIIYVYLYVIVNKINIKFIVYYS